MTIDEAITKYNKLANDDRTCYPEEAQQLAEWLEELKELREIKSGHLYATAFNRGYKKAISEHRKLDSLISECRRAMFDESDGQVLSDIHQGVNSGLSMAIHFAEQLKEE